MIYAFNKFFLKFKIFLYKCFHYKLFKGIILHGIPEIVHYDKVSFGLETRINPNVFLQGAGGITIGKNVTLSYGATILSTGYFLTDWNANKYRKEHEDKPVLIADNVWVGANVTILSGVSVSEGVVIAAGSVVTRNLDNPNTLYAGSPARIIREL